jgi:hypothetical protein
VGWDGGRDRVCVGGWGGASYMEGDMGVQMVEFFWGGCNGWVDGVCHMQELGSQPAQTAPALLSLVEHP